MHRILHIQGVVLSALKRAYFFACKHQLMSFLPPTGIMPVLCSRPFVVGNGPIRRVDRARIQGSNRCVIRFNNLDNWHLGEKTTVHVVRHPSGSHATSIDASRWHVAVLHEHVPKATPLNMVTFVYESQYAPFNIATSSVRLFPNCTSCTSCAPNLTYAGASTGAVVLSALDTWNFVEQIDVYGMNWHGSAKMHIDFADTTLVKRCCGKCVFHMTSSDSYSGHFISRCVDPILASLAIAIVMLVSAWWCR